MSSRHVVFDLNVLVNLFLRRGDSAAAEALSDKVLEGKITGWVAAQSLPTLEYLLVKQLKNDGLTPTEARASVRELLQWLTTHYRVLSLPGVETVDKLHGAHDLEDAQIALAATALAGAACIVTEDKSFDACGLVPALSPAEVLAALSEREASRAIQFVDLQEQQRTVLPSLEGRLRTVLRHGHYIMGPEVAELEKKLAEYVGVKHAIGCSSGTDALLLPLMALGVGPGDAVFTTPFTFIATAEVISLLGATPVFVDIDPLTYNIDPAQLEKAIRAVKTNDPAIYPLPTRNSEPGTRNAGLRPAGVIAVDLYGLPADYDRLQELCTANGLFLLEDAAQSFGGEHKGRKAGSFGDAAATSFFPAKPLGCYGDGGMVFTNRDDIAEICRSLLVHGKGKEKYDNVRIGLNARLDTLQAAIVLAKFEAFPAEVEARQDVARRYTELLSPGPGPRPQDSGLGTGNTALGARISGLRPPHVPGGCKSAWAQYTIRLAAGQRTAIESVLKRAGVPTAVYYPKPLHLQGAFRPLGYGQGDFPESERASTEVLSLPFGPHLDDASAHKVTAALR
ncbi:MAG: DegT/DnrJ/EryC1/StrS family aminotransferase [Deltaproteobacteria bacterium]|nr:DegT/DnrJ/EryC1/StrS family aminotransferase [Deltaproteobacteria bacterium]